MPLRILRCSAVLFLATFLGTIATHAQSAAEYGIMTGTSAGATAAARPLIPFPNIAGAAGSPNAGTGGVAGGTAESAAKTNLGYFQAHAGPNAALVAVRTTPDHASAWVDGRFVGPAPLDLKLAPGHHQVLVRAPNMKELVREFDVTAKQPQSIEMALQSAYQNQVVIHWPAQK